MTPEGQVKKDLKDYLNGIGTLLWYYCPVPFGYGRVGVPDFIGCYKGVFFSVETKKKKGKAELWQIKEAEKIIAAQGTHILARSMAPVKQFIEAVDALQPNP